MNNAVWSATITLAQHHQQNYAAGKGHKSALIPITITRQQDQALRLPNFTQHHTTILDLAKMQLGQLDQAIRLSNALSTRHLASQWGNPNPDDADHQSTFTRIFVLLPAHTNYSFEDFV
jgi:hypothetical protein